MKLQFLGANRQVTGSRYVLEAGGVQVLVDCGLFQEREFLERNWCDCPAPASKVRAVLLTHAHLDHCGLLPRFVREGFNGPIYTTEPTVELAAAVMRDSAEIQTEDAAYKKRRHEREGRHGKYPEQALYTAKDAERTVPLLRGVRYGETISISEHIQVRYFDAGHILGSAMLEVEVREGSRSRKIVFSGDIGQPHKPIIRDPSYLTEADFVVMESTYGDRDHADHGDVESQLAKIINDTASRGGHVIIPTFAIERAQELVYHLNRLIATKRIPSLDAYVDSPMAADVTDIYGRYHDYFDEETFRMIQAGQSPFKFRGLKFARSTEESKAINQTQRPCIIMSTAGMCNAGRIKHHLRQNLGKAECTVLFVGYQSHGTLGRQILDGAKEVRIHGKSVMVRANVAQIYGFSGHADRGGLLDWLAHFKQAPQRLFLTHGEADAAEALAAQVRTQFQWKVDVPEYLQSVEL